MIRNAAITAIVALGLTLTVSRTGAPVYGRVVVSAQRFRQHFHDLEGAGKSLSPLERFFFSLALTTTSAPEPVRGACPPQRT
jgi:hypothetical protein